MDTLIKNIADLNCVRGFSNDIKSSLYQEARNKLEKQLHRSISDSEFEAILAFSQDVYNYIRKEDPLVTESNLIYPRVNIVETMVEEGYKPPEFLNINLTEMQQRRHHRAQTC